MSQQKRNFISVAKRENNNKRGYLIVNPCQGKHIPMSPSVALCVFEDLAHLIDGKYENEKIFFVGFAETATAIGAQVAAAHRMPYIQTTREIISDDFISDEVSDVEYLYFSEEHSHATEQKLVKNDIDSVIDKIDRIIFVEDELTTGKTILNIVDILQKTYEKKLRFSVMSILNGMDEENISKYASNKIDIFYLEKINHSNYDEIANSFSKKGDNFKPNYNAPKYNFLQIDGGVNARRLVNAPAYIEACDNLAAKIFEKIKIGFNQRILVLGTEEFMYPAIYVGKKIEEKGNVVKTHSTTRSPISVFTEDDYPLNSRHELASIYDKERRTFIYNLDVYDKAIIITDSTLEEDEGINSLVNAVQLYTKDITVVRWLKNAQFI